MKNNIKYYDVLVVGAGPAGSITALLLSKHGFKVAIIDITIKRKVDIGECLPPECKPFLDQLGLWNKLKTEGHLPCYGNQSVWEDDFLHTNDFIYSPWGHGWHLDRIKFDLLLKDESKKNNVDMFLDTKITNIQLENSKWIINGVNIFFIAKFLVDATGRASWLSYKLGSKRQFFDYQIAIVGRFKNNFNYDKDSFTLIETSQDGWWYSAALPSGYRVVTFFTDPKNSRFIKNRSHFLNEISKTFYISKRLFPNYVLESNPFLWPANTSILSKIAGKNWLAVGDAAITHDPLSSYGLTFALQTSFQAASIIKSSFNHKLLAISKYEETLKQQFKKFLLQLKYIYSKSKFSTHYWKRFDLVKY